MRILEGFIARGRLRGFHYSGIRPGRGALHSRAPAPGLTRAHARIALKTRDAPLFTPMIRAPAGAAGAELGAPRGGAHAEGRAARPCLALDGDTQNDASERPWGASCASATGRSLHFLSAP